VKLQAKPAVLALAATLLVSACSVLDGDKIDYRSAGKAPSLEVPPDLTQLSRDSRYIVAGGGTVSASSFQSGQAVPGSLTAPNTVADVRIERAGQQRWLVINRTPEQLWGPVRDFWTENGFLLAQDQAALGIMETDWAENRAKIPQDFIRNTLGKLIDNVYSTSERDKFRTRLERSPGGGTEIFISHRGMQEVYANNATRDRTIWQPRPTDPELEAEFLRRLMVRLGLPAEQSKGLVASAAPVRTTSRVATVGGTTVVQIDDAFDRAWRRVGLTLDRTGFTVEDRDRSQGTYFVRYVEPTAERTDKPGFFSRLFGAETTAAPVKYRISVKSEGASTNVAVLNANGAPEASATATRILQVIADDLK
jgi:outer membrane protein assembly factor BamC